MARPSRVDRAEAADGVGAPSLFRWRSTVGEVPFVGPTGMSVASSRRISLGLPRFVESQSSKIRRQWGSSVARLSAPARQCLSPSRPHLECLD
jgi:hypothetical protein